MNYELTGRAWVFGDSIDTDAMYPGFAMRLPVPEAARHVFYDFVPAGPATCGLATSSWRAATSASAPAARSRR